MVSLDRCPVCDGAQHTLVCKYNGLILLRNVQGSDLARSEFACCHTCGLVFALRRPEGAEFEYLSSHFNEFLGRAAGDDANPLDYEHPLTDTDREALRRHLRGGWLVSEDAEPPTSEWMPWILYDRMSQGYHFDWLSESVPLEGARVLEIRAKTGALLDMLRRYHHADVYAMPMFESQQFVIEEQYGIPCKRRVDFEHFEVPYDGTFDLIIAKHLFTHALQPREMFRALRAHLKPDGHLYLYAENDDTRMYQKSKNLFGEQKCFHFQNFDLPTYARCLGWQGFKPVFIRHPKRQESQMTCLARVDDLVHGDRIPPNELESRLTMYEDWHDRSLLQLPTHAQTEIGHEAVEAARARDFARQQNLDASQRKPSKAFRIMHQEGYDTANAAETLRSVSKRRS